MNFTYPTMPPMPFLSIRGTVSLSFCLEYIAKNRGKVLLDVMGTFLLFDLGSFLCLVLCFSFLEAMYESFVSLIICSEEKRAKPIKSPGPSSPGIRAAFHGKHVGSLSNADAHHTSKSGTHSQETSVLSLRTFMENIMHQIYFSCLFMHNNIFLFYLVISMIKHACVISFCVLFMIVGKHISFH